MISFPHPMSADPRQPDAISIIREAGDEVAFSPPVGWATERLRSALEAKGAAVRLLDRGPADAGDGTRVLVSGAEDVLAGRVLERSGVSIPRTPEAVGLIPVRGDGAQTVLATGSDTRGLVYAILELADRVEHGGDPARALRVDRPVVERPTNAVRSVARSFASELNDKPWFHDEGSWRRYLSMVVAQRFNRVNLMVGLGYNFPWRIGDPYLYFAYPFLVDVPGSGVRVPQLADEERDRNLAMLRFISDEAVARGLDFQFAMWTHAYEWFDSADAPYTIEGLDPEHHAAYCADAIGLLLDACPSISGVTIRTHGESGVPERSWAFWKTVFDGIVGSGRRVGLDLHAKGVDAETLDLALASGLPITLSPKFSAEHMGLPYHQAAMRELDRPPTGADGARVGKASFMTVSEGSRPFTRYSYGDFLRGDRPYDVVFRIWPGTQRVLLWGDPAMAAGFGRNAGLAGSSGLEWCEPLSLKGREGTGLPGSRDGYADPTLSTQDDWEKHAYTYRLFGRLLYDPEAPPETWRRALRATFGTAASTAESALAGASRVLPLVTSAHHPSASNNYYWPEVYTDIAIVGNEGSAETHYYDTPEPKRFGTVGPLDPELFLSPQETVHELLPGSSSGRYSALDVAAWLDRIASDAAGQLASLPGVLPDRGSPAARRFGVDVAIQAALARFFAGKLRAAVHYERYLEAGDRDALRQALASYRSAREAWADVVERAAGVYVDDLTYGPQPWLRGTWSDRLPAIDRDIEAMAALVGPDGGGGPEIGGPPPPVQGPSPTAGSSHRARGAFRPGEDLPITLDPSPSVAGATLRYRHVNQAERYVEEEMLETGGGLTATIPAAYTGSAYPIQYLFVLRDRRGRASLFPGLGDDLSGRPYFVTRALRPAT
jgi:hypothetical protein